MKVITDRISRYPGRVKLIPLEGEDEYELTRADEPLNEGTPVNAKILRGIYGMENSITAFNEDGSITETDPDSGTTLKTIFNSDGSIDEIMTDGETGRILNKKTTFNSDGSISEVIS